MARGRLAKNGMLRRLIRVKSTLPRRPSPSLRRVSLRRVSPRRSPRRAAPPRPPRRSSRYRGAFTRPARWHGASARSRPAQRAITPQQWIQRAITPQQWIQRAITPQQWIQRAGTPHPRPLRVEIRAARHLVESVATLRPRYRHSIRLSVQFVATDCMANRRRSVSSRLGRLYVSCGTCLRSDVSRPPTREGALFPRHPRTPNERTKKPAPRGCGPTKAGCESISRRWK